MSESLRLKRKETKVALPLIEQLMKDQKAVNFLFGIKVHKITIRMISFESSADKLTLARFVE